MSDLFRFGIDHPDYPVRVLNEREARAGAGLLLLLAIEFLVARGLFRLGRQRGPTGAVIQFRLALVGQTLFLLLLFAGLLGLLFIDQACLEQLIA